MAKKIATISQSSEVKDFRSLVRTLGFEQVNAIKFSSESSWYEEGETDTQYWFWHHHNSILLIVETYDCTHINGVDLHFNYKNTGGNGCSPVSAHNVEIEEGGNIWIGIDVNPRTLHSNNRLREKSFSEKLQLLQENGDFLQQWIVPALICPYHNGDEGSDGLFPDDQGNAVLKERLKNSTQILTTMGIL